MAVRRRLAALLAVLVLAAAGVLAGCGGDDDGKDDKAGAGSGSTQRTDAATPTATTEQADEPPAQAKTKPKVVVPEGKPPRALKARDITKGKGPAAKPGDSLTVQYVGVSYSTRKEFDASWNRGQPFTFPLGGGQVIPGWDKGLEGMKAGGRRELTIPPELAYGPQGQPPDIGPDETLVFVIDLERID